MHETTGFKSGFFVYIYMIMDTFREQSFGSGVAFLERLFCTQTVHLIPECLALLSHSWPLRGVTLQFTDLNTFVCVNNLDTRSSTHNFIKVYAKMEFFDKLKVVILYVILI